jgi:hypothetical protein
MFLSLNPLLKCHNMCCKQFCHRKSDEQKFSSHKLYVSFGITHAEKYSRRCKGCLDAQAGWEKASNVNIEQLFQWRS